jgi:hypothetical protein
VPAEHHVAQPLPFQQVHDIGDMGGEIDTRRQQMRALAQPGQRRRKNNVAIAAKPIGDAPPAPAAMPSTVNQHKGVGHQSPLPHADAKAK